MKRSPLTLCPAVALLLALSATPAHAQIESGRVTIEDVSVPGVDKDGDGCLDRSEVNPGGQLDKRFSTRDANSDGKLCKDEYFTP